MTFQVGDQGQRYEHWCDDSEGPKLLGWSDHPERPFKAGVEAHPDWSNHRAIDRWKDLPMENENPIRTTLTPALSHGERE
jgi:hypothetical protein